MVEVEGDVEGRDGYGLEEAVEDRVQEEQGRGLGDSRPEIAPGPGPADQGAEVFAGVAAHCGQKFLAEGRLPVELNFQVETVNPGVGFQEAHPGLQGFFQAGEQVLVCGGFLHFHQGLAHQVQSQLEDMAEDAFFIREVLV